MYNATDGIVLPTTIIGSLPRPAWYTEQLGRRSFREAMVNARFREQYVDAVSAYLRDRRPPGSTSAPTATAASTTTSAGTAGSPTPPTTWTGSPAPTPTGTRAAGPA